MHTAIVRRVLAATLIFPMALLGVPTPVLAGTVGTATVIQLEERQQQMGRVRAMLAREDVRQAMIQLGVASEDAQQRVEALSPDELTTVEQHLNTLPAGGNAVLVIIGVVFIVLLILEITGVTDVFKKL